MYIYTIGVAAMGLVIGMFVGLSDSPVIGILLPLLFTLLAGGSGLYVVLSGDSARARLLGSSLAAFAFTVAISAVLAANHRVSGSVFSAIDKKPWIIDDVPIQEQIDLFEIALAFQFLGIPEKQRTTLIERVKPDPTEFLGTLKAATHQLHQIVGALLIFEKENPKHWDQADISLSQTRERLNRLSALLESHVPIPTNLIKELGDLNCTLPIVPQAKALQSNLRRTLNAFYVACTRLVHIAEAHPSSILADLHNRLKNIGNNWPESRLIPEDQPLHFENR